MESGEYVLIRDSQVIPSSLLSLPTRYSKYIDHVLLNHGLILDRIHRLAEIISEQYANSSVTILVILKGAFKFAKDLIDAIDRIGGSVIYNLEFIKIKSYENEHQHDIHIGDLEKITITSRNILVVEDLVDSGKTLNLLKQKLLLKNPSTLRVMVLIYKRNQLNNIFMPDYIGFSIPNEWIVGYNMDYNEKFRDLDHIGILNAQGKEDFRV